jgi:hypothetical protein
MEGPTALSDRVPAGQPFALHEELVSNAELRRGTFCSLRYLVHREHFGRALSHFLFRDLQVSQAKLGRCLDGLMLDYRSPLLDWTGCGFAIVRMLVSEG